MPTSPSNQHAPNTSKLTQHTNQPAPNTSKLTQHTNQPAPSSSNQSLCSSSSPSNSSKASSPNCSNQSFAAHQFSSWRISAWSVLIFIVALNLRPSIAAVGPVLQQIGTTFGYTPATLGILTAIPLVAFATASPLVTPLAARLGSDHTMLIALLAIAVGNAMRTFGAAPGLWLGTVLFSSAMAVGNVLVPVIIRRDFGNHVPVATAFSSACITTGSALAGLTASPLADYAHSWQLALGMWALPALLTAALWVWRMFALRSAIAHRTDIAHRTATALSSSSADATPSASTSSAVTTHPTTPATTHVTPCPSSLRTIIRHIMRMPSTWWITAFMGLQSSAFYTMTNWLPSVSVSFGNSPTLAGAHLFIFQALGIIAGFAVPWLMRFGNSESFAAVVCSIPMVCSGFGMLLLPQAVALWCVVGGFAQGACLVVALTLIALRGQGERHTVVLSSLVQSLGYLLAATGPLIFGVCTQITANHMLALVVFSGTAVLQCVVAYYAGRR